MGYYTRYKLEVLAQPDVELLGNKADICGELEKILSSEDEEVNMTDGHVFDSDGDGCFSISETIKWYSHQEDMRNISKRFQDVLFKLSGEGEESYDLWVEYYLNGKMQREYAIITFGDFDLEKLK